MQRTEEIGDVCTQATVELVVYKLYKCKCHREKLHCKSERSVLALKMGPFR